MRVKVDKQQSKQLTKLYIATLIILKIIIYLILAAVFKASRIACRIVTIIDTTARLYTLNTAIQSLYLVIYIRARKGNIHTIYIVSAL